MEKSAQNEKLKTYSFENKEIKVGFANFQDAEDYIAENGGKLVEVGFKDGNDNPEITNEAGLIQNMNHFVVNAGPEYQFIHSAHPNFRNLANQLQQIKADHRNDSPEEKYITNAEIETSEDPIIVLKNNQPESVTSRERSKYLKHAKVYEIGVEQIKK